MLLHRHHQTLQQRLEEAHLPHVDPQPLLVVVVVPLPQEELQLPEVLPVEDQVEVQQVALELEQFNHQNL